MASGRNICPMAAITPRLRIKVLAMDPEVCEDHMKRSGSSMGEGLDQTEYKGWGCHLGTSLRVLLSVAQLPQLVLTSLLSDLLLKRLDLSVELWHCGLQILHAITFVLSSHVESKGTPTHAIIYWSEFAHFEMIAQRTVIELDRAIIRTKCNGILASLVMCGQLPDLPLPSAAIGLVDTTRLEMVMRNHTSWCQRKED